MVPLVFAVIWEICINPRPLISQNMFLLWGSCFSSKHMWLLRRPFTHLPPHKLPLTGGDSVFWEAMLSSGSSAPCLCCPLNSDVFLWWDISDDLLGPRGWVLAGTLSPETWENLFKLRAVEEEGGTSVTLEMPTLFTSHVLFSTSVLLLFLLIPTPPQPWL